MTDSEKIGYLTEEVIAVRDNTDFIKKQLSSIKMLGLLSIFSIAAVSVVLFMKK